MLVLVANNLGLFLIFQRCAIDDNHKARKKCEKLKVKANERSLRHTNKISKPTLRNISAGVAALSCFCQGVNKTEGKSENYNEVAANFILILSLDASDTKRE